MFSLNTTTTTTTTTPATTPTFKGIQGKVALVVGGAGGIGSVVSNTLAKNGANVVVADINEDKAAKVLSNLPTVTGTKHMAVKMDVTSSTEVQTVIEKINKVYSKSVELAVNCAGVNQGESHVVTMKETDFDRIVAVKLKGVFVLMQVVGKSMVNSKRPGSVVNVSSTLSTVVREEWAHLSAAEAGANQLVHVTAKEWIKHGIRVNTVMPGLIDTAAVDRLKGTEMWQNVEENSIHHRVGKPEDVAEAVIFLLSENSSYVTGTELVVAGKPQC